ncbi:MAG: hypothetical protein RIC30_15930 [Marinoscillum sp.]|uniref:hypothetical protein n=1 Tax=Marinoscillum sp. TaxID=2024838 RepID=UPI0032F83255
MRKVILIMVLISACLLAVAQPDRNEYDTEITWGLNKNTRGGLIGGVVFKLAKQKKEDLFAVYGIEIMNVKHRQEQRYLSPTSGTSFVWGKQNFLYSIRGLYGREALLFKKAPQQGVQISGIVAGGPTIGVIAPYYILYNGNYVPFDSEVHRNFNSIQGSGKLFQGLGESELTFGLNAKAGLSFEFGAFKNNVAGVEMGVTMEAFPKEIILIPTQKNSAVFSALYFTMYWGTRR